MRRNNDNELPTLSNNVIQIRGSMTHELQINNSQERELDKYKPPVFTKIKGLRTCKPLIFLWSHSGLNQGPLDYES